MPTSTNRRPAKNRIMGCETPRIWTRPLRRLTRQTTLGYQAIEFAREVCGIDLYPWQKWLLLHMLELAPGLTVSTMHKRGRLEPLFRFRRVVLLVGRQNGKTTLLKILALFFMYALGARLVLGTAQDLDTAEQTWQDTVDLCVELDDDDEPLHPELHALVDAGNVVQVNGKKALVFSTGEKYKVKAASRKAGRGLSGDLCLLDELREHQTWDAWAAITKTTNARAAALIVGLSNAGDAASVVLRFLRKMAHAALGDPDGINSDDDPAGLLPAGVDEDVLDDLEDEDDWDSLGIFEWSAPPGCDRFDRQGWAQSNPSLGYGISIRTLKGDAESDPEWVFRTEVLCQWPEGSIVGPFPAGSWQAGIDPTSARAPGARVSACVDVSHDRSTAYISIAAERPDGRVHAEVVARRAGTDWVLPWFLDDSHPERADWPITGQTNGAPVSSVMQALKDAGLNVVDWAGADLNKGSGGFYDLVNTEGEGGEKKAPGVYHRPQPVLDIAAALAVIKALGDGWVWDRQKSPVDIAGLVSLTGAVWLHGRPVEAPPVEPRIRMIGGRT